jgi:hypothetical protein
MRWPSTARVAIDDKKGAPLRIGDGHHLQRNKEAESDFDVCATSGCDFTPQRVVYVIYARGGFAPDEKTNHDCVPGPVPQCHRLAR